MRSGAFSFWAIVLTSVVGMDTESAASSFLHPPVRLLDAAGASVVESGGPVSTIRSCTGCHDTQYIVTHSYHVSAGFADRGVKTRHAVRRPWDAGSGLFGRWSPLQYRFLTLPGDARLDLGTAEWIQFWGHRHVGGGPAEVGYGTRPLDEFPPQREPRPEIDPDRQVLNALNRTPTDWDWSRSGTVEMNCFLCHLARPNNQSRVGELIAGRFKWANTATLDGTGLVVRADDGWQYSADAFAADGTANASRLGIGAPSSEHCGQCHGQVHFADQPLQLDLTLAARSTVTRGQVFSPQRISDSAINLQEKQLQGRAWDVHAAAMLECQNCHFSLNDPKSYEASQRGRPEHLRYEPRRLRITEFLARPSHDFAQGHTEQGSLSRHLDGTMRGCDDCHDAEDTHDWLPYRARHFARLACEACHIAETSAPAIQMIDWTMISADGKPRVQWRGISGPPSDPTSPVTGFRPVLLSTQKLAAAVERAGSADQDLQTKLSPYNLISAWYWVDAAKQPRPVRLADLNAALFEDGQIRGEVLEVFDADKDGQLSGEERVVNSPAKVQIVKQRLMAVGVADPRIEADVEAFGLHHGVGPARSAARRCTDCHSSESQLARRFPLATDAVAGVMPKLISDGVVAFNGQVVVDGGGHLYFHPSTRAADLYLMGHDRWAWIQWLGSISVFAVLCGVLIHAGLRIRARRNRVDGANRSLPRE